MQLIELKNVYKRYSNGVNALCDVNLNISKGEFVFLIGASGSGKSTLIKLLYRQEKPTSGEVYVGGINVAKLRNGKVYKLRRKLGIVFQDYKLLPKKTVYENLEFVMRAVGTSPKEIRKRIPYVLELVGLENKANSYPTELSGGEQQRVAIARALVNNPSTIIADEPTGNLDPERSLELMSLLVKINQLGTTVVVVTHEKDLVNHFCKRVVTIESGVVVNDEIGCYVGGHIHG